MWGGGIRGQVFPFQELGKGKGKGLDWFTHVENVVDGQTTLISYTL